MRDFDLYVNPKLSTKIAARYGSAVSAREIVSMCLWAVNRLGGDSEAVTAFIEAMSLVMKNAVIVPHVEESEEDN